MIAMNKKILALILFSVLTASLFLSGCASNSNKTTTANHIAVIHTSSGTITVQLYDDKAPITTANFIKLANDGFYTNLVFHRVANLDNGETDTHVIQGGGFYANGTYKQSPYGPINLEIDSSLVHDDGAIAMARTSDPNSATSQFYICDGAQHFLDDSFLQQYGQRGYAVFGKVINGMDVVREIANVKTTTKYGMTNWPVNDVTITNITIS